jgi:hypothetical protein
MERASLIVPSVFVFVFASGRRKEAAIDHSSPVQELTETIFGAALSRPQRPISSLCRSSFSIPLFRTGLRFPFELSWSHRLLVDAETITLLQENFDLRFGIA